MNTMNFFRMSLLAVTLALTSALGAPAQAASTATVTLQSLIGNRTLECGGKDAPAIFFVRVKNDQIQAFARKTSRDERYSVDKAGVNAANVVIALSNDVDGPLQTDAIILPLTGLSHLGRGDVKTIQAFDALREGFNGTHTTYQLVCRLL